MSPYRDQVSAALTVLTIRGPTHYAWLGRASRPMPASLQAATTASEQRAYLVACLREELYWSFYCRGHPVPARWGAPEPIAADLRLQAEMSRANCGRGTWEPGWVIERVEGNEAIVAARGLRARISMSDCRVVAGDRRAGTAVQLRSPKELASLSPGFHTLVGDETADPHAMSEVMRVYWNLRLAGVTALVRALTSLLNGRRVPFRLKLADHPRRLDRCDAAVLYVPLDVFDALRAPLAKVASDVSAGLSPRVPAFALCLAPGMGVAEDVGNTESFGERRCALLAEAAVRGNERGIKELDARLDVVAAVFEEAGISIDAPYRDPALEARHVL
jgi:class II lanthipeptide synthase